MLADPSEAVAHVVRPAEDAGDADGILALAGELGLPDAPGGAALLLGALGLFLAVRGAVLLRSAAWQIDVAWLTGEVRLARAGVPP